MQHEVSNRNFEHECAPVCRIHVSFGNQQLASCRVTFFGSEMQSGALETRTENQKQRSKTQYKSATNSKHKCAPVCRIHVSFG
jgi:hypothetical protein